MSDEKNNGGDDGTRTHDFHTASVALSQLSYAPEQILLYNTKEKISIGQEIYLRN